ncbi:MarR family transcriptional regulator [Cytobacillus oceanisediminis]|uniref:MarR family transcriptional regulator n=1 Tax=Cytobacillus oceanisediminis TaxID=665099 RepID=UPI001C24BD69|nr:helix-turn-helix domain-containing protein [Cytobacillus oceanisediminis]MBU8732531.1 MarR family transcriptional regulator [Cytobacillus oceanisediminis]
MNSLYIKRKQNDDWLKLRFLKYMDLLHILEQRMNEENIATISQNEIADQMEISPSAVSKKINNLIKCGAIKKVRPGMYLLLENDINFTPYKQTKRVLDLFNDKPEIFNNYKLQAEILEIDMKDVQKAWGFLLADMNQFIK